MGELGRVSIVVPTCNRPGPLAELLESLFRQTHRRLQLVVINVGAVPVAGVLALYPELDPTLVEMRGGNHVLARNRGVELASGDWTMLCDDDDLLLPGHVERMLREIGDRDLVYSDMEVFEYRTDASGIRQPTGRFVFAYEHDLTAMRRFSTFAASGCLFRRELLSRIGPFDPAMDNYWDWDFYLRAVAAGKVWRAPVASVLYAFAQDQDHMSAPHWTHRASLDRLAAKHGLGPLPTANFFTLLREPEVLRRRARTEVLWDGEPFTPRRAVGARE